MRFSARARSVLLVVHRYVGLAMAAYLIVAGLTGSMMAFYVPLDRLLNPELFVPRGRPPGTPMLDPFTLRERLLEQLPAGTEVNGVTLRMQPDQALNYWVDGRETFVDPYDGKILGARTFGDVTEGRKSLLTFLYELHFSLGLGEVGRLMFGIVALLWTIDCFVGAYLTFPLPSQRRTESGKPWLARWLPMWLLKTNKLFTAVFTWHRASGLWVWMMLLIFAWSAVALNLGEVYEPVMGLFFDAPEQHELPELAQPLEEPPISLREAHAIGRRLVREESERRGFRILGETGISYLPEHGAYTYGIESSLDIGPRLAETNVSFTADGKLLGFDAPTGLHAGASFGGWLIALHFGSIREGGIAYRTFVCVLGFVVALLSVSGVWIWWKKRSSRAINRKREVPTA